MMADYDPSYDMVDEYADEMEALMEMEEESGAPSIGKKGKKSLDFSSQPTVTQTPTTSVAQREELREKYCLDDSFTQVAPLDVSVDENKENDSRKRQLSNSNQADSKRRRTEDEEATNAINSVLAIRERNLQKHQLESQSQIVASTNTDRPRVLNRIPNHAFMSVTTYEGKRCYLGMKSLTNLGNEAAKAGSNSRSMQLLSTPLSTLQSEADFLRAKRLSLAAESADAVSRAEDVIVNNIDVNSHALWVERYTPRQYMDLLSDESTNRTLLRWMKQWDYTVFGKEIEKKEQKPKEKTSWVTEALTQLDEHNRPMHKVALLHGPPGLGKTTLAHIVAKHAGYNVVEMNASDDRSTEIFTQKIESATQMKSVLESDPKPNCLIIDEIDGAPVAAINVLLSVIKGEKGKKKKKKDQGILRRPIICICNDLYVSSLRHLRPLSFVVLFPLTLTSSLANRLLQVSKHESVRTDLSTLTHLCEKTDNDIRSCLNTLQFVSRTSKELNLNAVKSLSIGQKDVHKSMMTVWQSVFQIPKNKKKVYINPYDRDSDPAKNQMELAMQSNLSRFDFMLNQLQAAGDYEKVMQGLYENFLDAKTKDASMIGVVQAYEWIAFHDALNQLVAHNQDYTMWAYQPFTPLMFHFIFASNSPHKVVYPKSGYEHFVRKNQLEGMLSALISDISVNVRKTINPSSMVLDLLPFLIHIIQPPLRPVNIQLYSAAEKKGLAQLIETMITFHLTYNQHVTDDGQCNYTLHPNLEELACFPTLKKTQKQFSYAAKQIIAREVEMEQMRRSEGARSQSRQDQPSASLSQSQKSKELPTHMRQKLEPKAIEEKVTRDFFGRPVVVQQRPSGNNDEQKKVQASKDNVIGGDIFFVFKEGYTNAIRKTVRIHDLL